MGILDFILGVIVIFVGAFVVIGTVVTIWNYKTLEDENKKLKEDLAKARERKMKREYKKVSNVGGKK